MKGLGAGEFVHDFGSVQIAAGTSLLQSTTTFGWHAA